jgi:hypothetical protein
MVFSDLLTNLTLSSSSTSSSPTIHAPDGLTLEMVLSDSTSPPFSLQDFSEYLKTTYCNENLLFYEVVTDYQSRCETYFGPPLVDCNDAILLSDGITLFDFTTHNQHLLSTREQIWFTNLKGKFELILQDFILSDAPQEINIPYETRHQLLQSYQIDQSYHPNVFAPACSAVVELLRISAFIPFATDPNRIPQVPVKKKKSFSLNKKEKHFNLDQLPPLPPTPTTPDIIQPIPSTSSGFLKRIITTSITKIKGSTAIGSTDMLLDSPPMSPPAPAVAKSWRQQMNMIPDFVSNKSTALPPTPPPPTLQANQSSLSTSTNRSTDSRK